MLRHEEGELLPKNVMFRRLSNITSLRDLLMSAKDIVKKDGFPPHFKVS